MGNDSNDSKDSNNGNNGLDLFSSFVDNELGPDRDSLIFEVQDLWAKLAQANLDRYHALVDLEIAQGALLEAGLEMGQLSARHRRLVKENGRLLDDLSQAEDTKTLLAISLGVILFLAVTIAVLAFVLIRS